MYVYVVVETLNGVDNVEPFHTCYELFHHVVVD